MTERQSKRQKFVSLRKALQDLKVNEEILNKMVDRGYINPVYEGDKTKFKEEEIFNVSRHIHASGKNAFLSIEDEDLYKSSAGAYESLFLTGTHEVMASQEQASKTSPPKEDCQFTDTVKTKKLAKQMQMSGQILKEADMSSPQIEIPEPRSMSKRMGLFSRFDFSRSIEKLKTIHPVWAAIIILFFLALIAWNIFDSPQPVLTQKVTINKVESFEFVPQLTVEGKIVAQKQTLVYAGIQGKIVKIFYHSEGAFVNKGDILAEIGNPAFDIDLQISQQLLTKANLQSLEANLVIRRATKKLSTEEMEAFERFRKALGLLKKQSLDLKTANRLVVGKNKDLYNLCMAELRYQLALQDLEIAKQNLKKREYQKRFLTVKAPASGILISIDMALHRRVTPESRLAVIADSSQKLVKAELRGTCDMPEGSTVQVSLSTGDVFPGKLISISSAVKEPRIALFQIDNPKDAPLGAKTSVKIALPAKQNTIQIPKSCVVRVEGSSPMVFWATPEEGENLYCIHSVPVKLGMSNEEYYEVKNGLSGGEFLVTGCDQGMRSLHDEMTVMADLADEL